ncbi:response regulator [Ktedonospora formicarum]|uniref:Two-component system response regulator n=1 Tax=Ktedonospora formicarum TaxID=2778364 RepID=A0A8J3MT60_9CHLR|nr:response regulator [Ktedonospora formicarum]GHO45298.1 two-component system response regulator [Ktedonospora formicarum]
MAPVTSAYPLLVVEDSDEDFEILQWALKKLSITVPVYRCCDGDEALDFLYRRAGYESPEKAPRPAIILLDLKLTATDGREVLETIKHDEMLKSIPVIIWTNSSDPKDIEVSFRQGASSYILKPLTLEKLLEAIALLNHYWFGVVALPGEVEE